MFNIGIPDILIGLVVVGVPLWLYHWAFEGFNLPKDRFSRYALVLVVTAIVAALVFNWATRFHSIAN
ncbi:MAG TPA: hypothetical protein VKB50_16140 [Vicinamibacterales bacterium]|nr:hypothetical protein [Vicinamibacterales bacterium]